MFSVLYKLIKIANKGVSLPAKLTRVREENLSRREKNCFSFFCLKCVQLMYIINVSCKIYLYYRALYIYSKLTLLISGIASISKIPVDHG